MYAPPQLNRVGDAREVILGYAFDGLDLDGASIIVDQEYAEEYDFTAGNNRSL